MKEALKKMTGPLEVRVQRFLFKYRVTPQATTGVSPAELLMGRRIHTHLDLLYPDIQQRVRNKQIRQKEDHDAHARSRNLQCEDLVYARNFGVGPKWLPGVLQKAVGQVSFEVRLDDGRSIHRHIDHLRVQTCHPEMEAKSSLDEDLLISPQSSSSQNNAEGDTSTIATGPPSPDTLPPRSSFLTCKEATRPVYVTV